MSVLRIKNKATGKWENVPFVNNPQKIGVVAGDNIEITPQGQDIKISAIVPDISNLATKEEVNAKQPIGDYALKSDVPSLKGLVNEEQLEQGLNTKQDKGNYALISDIPSLENYIKNTDFATQTVGGVVKMWTSTDEEGNIGLNISTEV